MELQATSPSTSRNHPALSRRHSKPSDLLLRGEVGLGCVSHRVRARVPTSRERDRRVSVPASCTDRRGQEAVDLCNRKEKDWLHFVGVRGCGLDALSVLVLKQVRVHQRVLAFVLKAMGDDVTAVVGAHVPQFDGGNIICGSSQNFVLEEDMVDKLAFHIFKDPDRETAILTLGAGDITVMGRKLLHELQQILLKSKFIGCLPAGATHFLISVQTVDITQKRHPTNISKMRIAIPIKIYMAIVAVLSDFIAIRQR